MENRGEIGLKLMIVAAILAVGFSLVGDVVAAGYFYCLSVFGGVLIMLHIIEYSREEIRNIKKKYSND